MYISQSRSGGACLKVPLLWMYNFVAGHFYAHVVAEHLLAVIILADFLYCRCCSPMDSYCTWASLPLG